MPRRSTGGIVEKETATRGTSFGIRFRIRGKRIFQLVGYSQDGTTRADAERELRYTLEQIRRGDWKPPAEIEAPRDAPPTFHVFASEWFDSRRRELRQATIDTYTWELSNHLLPFFAQKRLDQITIEDVDRYRRAKVTEGKLCASSINSTITRLGQILEVAVEYGHIERNVARGARRKLRAPTPARPSLEPDEVAALLDAARELDRGDRFPVRQPLLGTLALAGLRIGEAVGLRWRDVDLAGGTIRVRESKTDAGVREVDIQPELQDVLVKWRAGAWFTDPDDLVFPPAGRTSRTSREVRGRPRDRHNARKLLLRVADRANERLAAAGKPQLPEGLSPHALRRSYASWLIAEGEDPAYVMHQMGHTSPAMTLGLYAKAVRNGRRTVRSQRRLAALAEAAERAPLGSGTLEAVEAVGDELAA